MTDNYKENMKGQYLRSDDPELLFLYHFIDVLQSAEDFRAEHPYATAALCVTLVGTGAALVLPAVGSTVLEAFGFGAGGVEAGPCFTSGSFPPRHRLILTCREYRGFSASGEVWG